MILNIKWGTKLFNLFHRSLQLLALTRCQCYKTFFLITDTPDKKPSNNISAQSNICDPTIVDAEKQTHNQFAMIFVTLMTWGGCKPTYLTSSNICMDIRKSRQSSTMRQGKNGCLQGKYGCQIGWFTPTAGLCSQILDYEEKFQKGQTLQLTGESRMEKKVESNCDQANDMADSFVKWFYSLINSTFYNAGQFSTYALLKSIG